MSRSDIIRGSRFSSRACAISILAARNRILINDYSSRNKGNTDVSIKSASCGRHRRRRCLLDAASRKCTRAASLLEAAPCEMGPAQSSFRLASSAWPARIFCAVCLDGRISLLILLAHMRDCKRWQNRRARMRYLRADWFFVVGPVPSSMLVSCLLSAPDVVERRRRRQCRRVSTRHAAFRQRMVDARRDTTSIEVIG